MVEAVKYGASEFIAKPFDEDLLLSVIDKVLG
jgi:FixJ family two-component response regulator